MYSKFIRTNEVIRIIIVSYYIQPLCSECRHVILPKDIAALVPKEKLMSETEWRKMGVQQSRGWVHYMNHKPGMYSIF